MDERIETFMRDVASDVGKSPTDVAENTPHRLAAFVKLLRGEPGPIEADMREAKFRTALEARVVDDLRRSPGTATEPHLLIVLRTLRKARQQSEGSGFIDRR